MSLDTLRSMMLRPLAFSFFSFTTLAMRKPSRTFRVKLRPKRLSASAREATYAEYIERRSQHGCNRLQMLLLTNEGAHNSSGSSFSTLCFFNIVLVQSLFELVTFSHIAVQWQYFQILGLSISRLYEEGEKKAIFRSTFLHFTHSGPKGTVMQSCEKEWREEIKFKISTQEKQAIKMKNKSLFPQAVRIILTNRHSCTELKNFHSSTELL